MLPLADTGQFALIGDISEDFVACAVPEDLDYEPEGAEGGLQSAKEQKEQSTHLFIY
jgi:hypothetical protein